MLHKLIQAGQPVRPAGPLRVSRGALKQSCTRDEGVNQVRPGLHQRLRRKRERMPQAAGVFSGNGPRRPPGFDVAGQQLQDLAEGQVGVADAGVGIAVPAGDDAGSAVRALLGAPGEFLDQGRLAAAGFAGDEHHPALARQRQVQKRRPVAPTRAPGRQRQVFQLQPVLLQQGKGEVQLRDRADGRGMTQGPSTCHPGSARTAASSLRLARRPVLRPGGGDKPRTGPGRRSAGH